MGDLRFQVGDIVTRDGTDRQRVLAVDDDYCCIEVECIREPLGPRREDGTRGEPWCRLGETEHNLARRYVYPEDPIDGTPMPKLAGDRDGETLRPDRR